MLDRAVVIYWSATLTNMWLPLTILILAGAVAADYEHGWKTGNEYTYLVRSRTFTSLDRLDNQYAGMVLKAMLTVQAKDPSTLAGKVSDCKYAKIHKNLADGWETEFSDQMLDLQKLPLSGAPFEIKLKHGLIRDVIVDRKVPTWEVNLLKSIVSQLQVDSQGENAIKNKENHVPGSEDTFGSYRVIEDSVGGKCEVVYDVSPLPEHAVHMKPELVPMPQLKGDGHLIDITKTKNFDNCVQRMSYHFGIGERNYWEPGSNDNGPFLSKSASSRIVITGNLKSFTIQSSVTTSKMHASPRFMDHQNGMVVARMNLTLGNVKKMSDPLPSPGNPQSTGNLVYTFDSPFGDGEERRFVKGIESLQSNQLASDSISSVSSSEEETKTGTNYRSLSSSSSSGSSSSISSSEENDFWQPKPNLVDAPYNPLLPKFASVVEFGRNLVSQIANEINDPSSVPDKQSLEKFTILCEVIRTMSRKEIVDMESSMHVSPNELKSIGKAQAVKQNTWSVFRDAIAQAGTGPALLTIKKWIEKGDIGSWQAADVLSRIPKTARAPTAEYVKVFFELATSPAVTEDSILYSPAIVAFGELLYNSQVNSRSVHNRYPVHTFGRLTSKHDRSVQDVYIPYLSVELLKAAKAKDSPRIQTYITALGNIGHPKILSVFERFLEGKEQVTVFQRTLMVAALGKLAESYPKLARSVLYKIYLNTMESHEVRCTAVFLLLKTNPPFNVIQRMAEFTNYETNRHVNSAVKSALYSLSALTSPEHQELAKKCASAISLLTPNDFGYQYSHGYYTDTVNNERNTIYSMIANYIGSDDSLIPNAIYLGWYSSYGSFRTPPTEILAMISSMKQLADLSFGDEADKEQTRRWAAEMIAEQLNIVPEKSVPFEGNFWWSSKFVSWFLPFDKRSVNTIPNMLSKIALAMKDAAYLNINRLESYDVTISFPTESGLPFVYTFAIPVLQKLSGTNQVQLTQEPRSVTVKSEIQAAYSQNIIGRIGFIAPFDNEYYMAGVNVDFHAYLPVKFSLEASKPNGRLELKLWPFDGEQNARVFSYAVVPYTANGKISSLEPLIGKNAHLVSTDEIRKEDYLLTHMEGKHIKVSALAEESDESFWDFDASKLLEMPGYLWATDNDKHRELRVHLQFDPSQTEPLILSVAYDSEHATPEAYSSQDWSNEATAVTPINEDSDRETRMRRYLKAASKGIQLAQAHALDFELQQATRDKSKFGCTIAWAYGDAETKVRTLFYSRIEVHPPKSDFEVCMAFKSSSSPNAPLSYEQAVDANPTAEFDADIRFGVERCQDERFRITGKAGQSNELREYNRDTPIAKSCEEQMKQGNKMLRSCQDASAMAMIMDRLNISFHVTDEWHSLINWGLGFLGKMNLVDGYVEAAHPRNAGKDVIDMAVSLSGDLRKADAVVYTNAMDFHVTDIDLSAIGVTPEDALVAGDSDMDVTNLIYNELEPTCVLDQTRTQTFDGKEYPLKLGDCWHVVMTTYPKTDPNGQDKRIRIPEDSSVSVLSKDTEDGHREAKVMLGDTEVKFAPAAGTPAVTVNGQRVQVSKGKSYQKRDQNKEVDFEIYQRGERAVHLSSEKYDFYLTFDGKRIMIQTSDKYRDSIRGLCGNYDGDSSNDFMAPKQCMLRKSEQFIASYALTQSECNGDALKTVKSLQSHDCVPPPSNRYSNVINTPESEGSQPGTGGYHKDTKAHGDKRCSNYRTNVLETDGKICFTTRPVYGCAAGCKPTETKTKKYQYHCMENNQAAMNLKKRIEKGANPDLSQKPVTMSRLIDVPLACKA